MVRYRWSRNDFLYGRSGTVVAWIDPLDSAGKWEIIFQLNRGICIDRADSEAEARRIVERQFGV